jgi:hypothetical protein
MKNTVLSPQEFMRQMHIAGFQITDSCLDSARVHRFVPGIAGSNFYVDGRYLKLKELTNHQTHLILSAMGDLYPTMPSYQTYLETTDGLMVREVYYGNGEFHDYPTVLARIQIGGETLASAIFTKENHLNVLTIRGDVSLLKSALKVVGEKPLTQWTAEALVEQFYNKGFRKCD